MPEPDSKRPLLADLREELRRLGVDLRESVALRWQLALIEIKSDLRSAAWLVGWLIAAAVLLLCGLPVLVIWLAGRFAQWFDVSRDTCLLVFGLVLIVSALLIGLFAWRRFRRRFIGLEQTLEELREDARWIREWTSREEAAVDDDLPSPSERGAGGEGGRDSD
ncbi:MAG: phage holin family protein [Pirellulales bacterium]|nr:phage holin family protein [Pirellulales bacterium]